MTTLERARSKHHGYVSALAKSNAKLDKLLDALVREQSKKAKLIRTITRSGKRLDKLAVIAPHNAGPVPTVSPGVVAIPAEQFNTVVEIPASIIDDGIPEIFRRTPVMHPAEREEAKREFEADKVEASRARDAAIKAEIVAKQQETRKAKARARVEKMLAKKSGDSKKMPLTGRAAMAFINQK